MNNLQTYKSSKYNIRPLCHYDGRKNLIFVYNITIIMCFMSVLYKDDQGRILEVNYFSFHVRRIEVIDNYGIKYTSYIDFHKHGWPDNNNNSNILGLGPGALNTDAAENIFAHKVIFLKRRGFLLF